MMANMPSSLLAASQEFESNYESALKWQESKHRHGGKLPILPANIQGNLEAAASKLTECIRDVMELDARAVNKRVVMHFPGMAGEENSVA